MQIALLRTLATSEFGVFSFMLTLVQFGYSVSNALIATPYTVLANQHDGQEAEGRVFFAVNALFALAWGGFCAGGAIVLGQDHAAPVFGLLGTLSMIRWFGRAHLYALHKPTQAATSDLLYAMTLLVFLGLAWFTHLSMVKAALVFCAALIVGLCVLGRDYWGYQYRGLIHGRLGRYAKVWREQSRWTLLGVVTSEATANAHSYLVTFFAGPAAFAPLAAASLFLKPVPMVVTSLTQLERPVMARALSSGNLAAALHANRLFRISVLVVWAATVMVGSCVLTWDPKLLLKTSYGISTVEIAFLFWAAIAFLQSWSTSDSVLLQAAGRFQVLAQVGVAAALVSILGVTVMLLSIGPVYSLAGILLGQAVVSTGIIRLCHTWKTSYAPIAAV